MPEPTWEINSRDGDAFGSGQVALQKMSKTALGVEVFNGRQSSPILCTAQFILQRQTRVKLIRDHTSNEEVNILAELLWLLRNNGLIMLI